MQCFWSILSCKHLFYSACSVLSLASSYFLFPLTECKDSFEGKAEHNANGAYPVHDVRTVEGCADLCRETDGCVAFDWDHKTPPHQNANCWIHTGKNLLVKDEFGTDHYARIPCGSK